MHVAHESRAAARAKTNQRNRRDGKVVGRESSRRDDLIMFRMVGMPDIGSSMLSAPSPYFVFSVINAVEAAEPSLRRQTLAEFVTNSTPNYYTARASVFSIYRKMRGASTRSRKPEIRSLDRCRCCSVTKAAMSRSNRIHVHSASVV